MGSQYKVLKDAKLRIGKKKKILFFFLPGRSTGNNGGILGRKWDFHKSFLKRPNVGMVQYYISRELMKSSKGWAKENLKKKRNLFFFLKLKIEKKSKILGRKWDFHK